MTGFYIALAATIAAGAAFWFFRDRIAGWVPGWKHLIASISAFVLAVLQYLQTIDYSALVSTPKGAALAGLAVGLLVLVLSWVTPRKDS